MQSSLSPPWAIELIRMSSLLLKRRLEEYTNYAQSRWRIGKSYSFNNDEGGGTIRKSSLKVDVKVVATSYIAIMLTFGCLFKLLSGAIGNLLKVSSLDAWGTILIIASMLLFVLEIVCYVFIKKK